MNLPGGGVFRAKSSIISRSKLTKNGKYLPKCCYFFASEQTTSSSSNSSAYKRTQSKNDNVIQQHEMNEMVTQHKIRTRTERRAHVGRAEVQSWRRLTSGSGVIYSLLLALSVITLDCPRPTTSQQLTSFIRPQQQQQQQHYNYHPAQQHAQHSSTLPMASDRCKIGPPLQWRPHLDASSKAYLAPVVALATLKQFNLTPIQLAGSAGGGRAHTKNGLLDRLHSQQSMLFHAQSVNNVGVLIEATFQVKSLLRRPRQSVDLQQGRIIKLHYKVDASLSTTSDIITLTSGIEAGEGGEQQKVANKQQNQTMLPFYQEAAAAASHYATRGHQQLQPMINPNGDQCALELTEKELVKRGGKLFKVNQDYALFLEQTITTRKRVFARQQVSSSNSQQQQQQQLNRLPTMASYNQQFETRWVNEEAWHPFAAHEPMTNHTGRAIQKILCRGCVRAPTVQLVNSTFVSAQQDENVRQQQRRSATHSSTPSAAAANTIKLDCRVSGVPAPWVEWFRNGKLLRNKPNSRMRIKTSKILSKGRASDKLSRLEIDLQSGHNETGIYECRAMSVAAREPVVGTYTLLVMPAQYALIPMQQPIGGGGGGGDDTNDLDDSARSSVKQRAKDRKIATTGLSNDRLTESTTVRATSTTSVPSSPTRATATGPNKGNHDDGGDDDDGDDQATPTSTSPPPVLQTTTTTTSTSSSSTVTTTTTRPNAPPVQEEEEEQQRPVKNDNDNEPDDQRVVQIRPSQVGGIDQSTRRPPSSSESSGSTSTGTAAVGGASTSTPEPSKGRGKSSPVVVGQPCPGDAHDSFCLNRGTCVLIGHIEEYFCNCAEGYHGHRCEYKSLGHQQTSRR